MSNLRLSDDDYVGRVASARDVMVNTIISRYANRELSIEEIKGLMKYNKNARSNKLDKFIQLKAKEAGYDWALNESASSTSSNIETQNLAKKLDDLAQQAAKYDKFSKARIAIEDERAKVWADFRRRIMTGLAGVKVRPGLATEDHGMGFSHNVSVPGDENTMNKSTIGYLKEYNDPETRVKSISTPDVDRSTKLLYQYAKSGQISYDEFEDLLAHFISIIVKNYARR